MTAADQTQLEEAFRAQAAAEVDASAWAFRAGVATGEKLRLRRLLEEVRELLSAQPEPDDTNAMLARIDDALKETV